MRRAWQEAIPETRELVARRPAPKARRDVVAAARGGGPSSGGQDVGSETIGAEATGGHAGGMPTNRATRIAVDEAFLGLEDGDGPGRAGFVIAPHLARFDHRLYGGTAIAVSLAVSERVTGRDALWATTQFSSTAMLGDRVECLVEELARGRRTSQVRITATAGGEVVFVALGATGEHKPDGLAGSAERMPEVTPPDQGREAGWNRADSTVGWHLATDLREAKVLSHPDPGRGRMCLWTRLKDGEQWTPARLAFVADMVPVSVARSLGVHGAGTSLDNTLRCGPMPGEGGWVLVDLRPHLAFGGYGHGTVHLWSESGELLATGSQTASMLVFESDPLQGLPPA